jgi:hypothetical protein
MGSSGPGVLTPRSGVPGPSKGSKYSTLYTRARARKKEMLRRGPAPGGPQMDPFRDPIMEAPAVPSSA